MIKYNTCLGQNLMLFALCEQCQVHQNSDRNSVTNKTMNDTRPMT
jgi:hypothetical protein